MARRGNVKEFDARAASSTPLEGSLEDGARKFIEHIEKCAEAALVAHDLSTKKKKASEELTAWTKEEERAALERALKKLRPAFDEIIKWAIEPLKEAGSSKAEYLFEQLWILLGAAFVSDQYGFLSEGARSAFASFNGAGPRQPNPIDIEIQKLKDLAPRLKPKEIQTKLLANPALAEHVESIRGKGFYSRVSRVKNSKAK